MSSYRESLSGEATRTVWHRFTCGKCGKTTEWIPTNLYVKAAVETPGRDAETYLRAELQSSLSRELNNYCYNIRSGATKGYYFTPPPFTNAEYAYNLDRRCPHCGSVGKIKGGTGRSGMWGTLAGLFIGFILFSIIISTSDIYELKDIIVPVSAFLAIVFAGWMTGFFVGKKRAGKSVEHTDIQYRFNEEEPQVKPEKPASMATVPKKEVAAADAAGGEIRANDPDFCMAEVEATDDRAELLRIMRSRSVYAVRKKAVEKLSDPTHADVVNCKNHNFTPHSGIMTAGRDTEIHMEWEECSLCGLWRNYEENVRFTDY